VLTRGESARVKRLIALVSLLAVGATYFGAWSLGLWWDDYVALRPWRPEDVAAAFTGSWDRWDVWPVFYRPLSVAWYALSFEMFGLHALPMHVVSLVGLAAAAWLTGLFAWRETGAPMVGMAAAALYGTHPAVALAQGTWLFLQNHLLCTLIVLATLLSWQKRRARPALAAWWPLFALAFTGFLVQEDMIMLAPVLLVLQFIRARTVNDVPGPDGRLVIVAIGFAVCLVAGRWVVLGELGGLGFPSVPALVANGVRGLVRTAVLLEIPPEGIGVFASAGLALTTSAGVWLATRAPRTPVAALLATGVCLAAAFSAPLVFASSWSRFHLVALGAILALAASAGAARQALPVTRARWPAIWIGVLAVMLGAAARPDATHPGCSEPMLWSDTRVLEDWPQVPAHVRSWLAAKPAACAQGDVASLTSSIDLAVWIVDDPSGTLDHANETGGAGTRVVALVTKHARVLALDVRAAPGQGPVHIRIAASGAAPSTVVASDEWLPLTVPLSPGWRTRLRDMHRVDLTGVGDDSGRPFEIRGLRAVR